MPAINYDWDDVEDNIVEEYDDAGITVAEYTTLPGLYGNIISQNRAGVESQFHYDALGSTLAVTDDNQNVTDTFAYTAFGDVTERTGTTEVPVQYIGQKGYYRGASAGDCLVRQRNYDPPKSRWLSVDPIPDYLHSNAYAYCHANPINKYDLSGTIILWCAHQVDRLKCAVCARLVGFEVLNELWLRGIDVNDWANGGRAMLHCVAVCRSSRQCRGSCLYWWQARETGTTVADEMGRHNNRAGDTCAFASSETTWLYLSWPQSCLDCCLDQWKAGALMCQRGAPPYTLEHCPPPS
jgi:RHS repeat-associated core domain